MTTPFNFEGGVISVPNYRQEVWEKTLRQKLNEGFVIDCNCQTFIPFSDFENKPLPSNPKARIDYLLVEKLAIEIFKMTLKNEVTSFSTEGLIDQILFDLERVNYGVAATAWLTVDSSSLLNCFDVEDKSTEILLKRLPRDLSYSLVVKFPTAVTSFSDFIIGKHQKKYLQMLRSRLGYEFINEMIESAKEDIKALSQE